MAFSPESDVVVINDAGAFSAKVAQRVGAGRTKPRRTIEIISEPLLHDFDANMLGAKPAEAIRAAIQKGIRNVAAFASAATIKRRERAARHLSGSLSPAQQARGESYRGTYDRQYSGGRMGARAPNQTPRLFNDSGRMSEGVFVRQNPTDATFTVNVPANRLDPGDFRPGAFDRMIALLREHVPVLADTTRLLADDTVRSAIAESISDMITKGDSRQMAKLEALARARKQAVLAIIRAFAELAP